ncbi:MAG: class I SAM-dependent methyltransferase [Candidatus Eisenbacteria bacterium]|uniref:Class I SAM-dependent methyltransferase n=1 Tax=Eiseniibacteriota bacterium TaxID=2212470 RepID=A0A538SHU8_UNCEI|nr:MAG: class I SAM-dependent methyltransferase [Candidatus Eisenbacteria bacterium]
MQPIAKLSRSDRETIKVHQQPAWASGDLGRVELMLQIVGELLCQAVDLRWCDKVLDVAAGNGRSFLAAARRFAETTSTDCAPELDRGLRAAGAEGLTVLTPVTNAENLRFGDGDFDVALSAFGVMFAPNQRCAAVELLRVVKPGGRIGLANWTPDGFFGQLFRVTGTFVPPAASNASPAAWGTETRLVELFGPRASEFHMTRKKYVFHYLSAEHWIGLFRRYYGPVHQAFAALDAPGQKALHAALLELLEKFHRGGRDGLIVPAEYLEVVIWRA